MMTPRKYYFYEIGTVSFGLALLAYFGTLSFFPMEIMSMGDGQSWYWVFILLTFSTIGALLLVSFYKHYALIIVRILDLTIAILGIWVIITFLIFTKDLLEPWLVQGAWFLRYNGLLIGIFLSCVMIKTVAGISFIVSINNDTRSEGLKDTLTKKRNRAQLVSFSIVSLIFAFYSLEMLFYRYLSFYYVLVSIFIIQVILLFSSIYLASYSSLKVSFAIEPSSELKGEDKITTLEKKGENQQKEKSIKGFRNKLNEKLLKAGTKPKNFWWLFVPLLIVAIINGISVIFYLTSYPLKFSFLYGQNTTEVNLPLIQIVSYFILLITFFILTFTVFGSKIHHKFGDYYEGTRHSHLKRSTLGSIDAFKFLGLFLVMSQILYFFDYPLYFPRIVSWYLLFGICGALIYYIAGISNKIRNILYASAVLFLVYNFYLTYNDGIENGVNYYNGSFETAFPFVYLHNWLNFILVGIPVGIIISDFILNFAFNRVDATDSTNKAVFLAFTCFVGALLIMPGNYILNPPGGDIGDPENPNLAFTLFYIVLSSILLVGLFFNHFIVEIVAPWVHTRKIAKGKKVIRTSRKYQSVKEKVIEAPIRLRKKVAVISLTSIVSISLLGGLAIYFAFQTTQTKPLLAYSPGNYYVWLQNSSERVSKDATIAYETSPKIDAIKISLAKNEYEAVQIVWRPLRKYIYSLSYEISNFEHEDNPSIILPANCFSLRYEEAVLEEEFPDVLVPFEEMNIDQTENYVFWVSLKTPYNALEGEYSGELKFTFNSDETETIDIKLDVWNFTVPNTRHLRTNIGTGINTDERIQNYIYHRINDYGVPIYFTDSFDDFNSDEQITCFLNVTSNNWLFNWTWWDTQTGYKLNNSINGFTVQYPLGISEGSQGREPYIDDNEKMTRLKRWLSKVEDHLENKSWLPYAYYYFIDEFQMIIPSGYTRKEYFDALETLLKEMKEAAPKLKIMTTTPPSDELEDIRKYIDIYCPISSDRDKERWDERLDAGCEMWFYPCVGPFSPWPNSHLYNRLYECRVLLWQVWLYNVHGFLYWSSQAYYHGHYGLAYNGYGDGWFIYEREGKLYDTLRWENYLDGNEDYEFIWLLDATLDYLEENSTALPVGEIEEYRDELDDIVMSIAGERWQYCDHPSYVYDGRERIGSMLSDLNEYVNTTIIGEQAWFPPYKSL